MTCIVLDDEELSVNFLVDKNIRKVPYLKLMGTFTDPQEALLFLQTNTVDLIFLDIEMPNFDIDGIDFMKLMKADQRYILVTAHAEYALESYEYNVVDYLRKPYSFDRFAKAVQKAQERIQLPAQAQEVSPKPIDSLYVRSDNKKVRMLFDSIYYVEADRNYATIFRADDHIATKTTLNKLEGEFPVTHFRRVHKSYIVSLDKIEFVEKDQIGVKRTEGIVMIPLSSLYKKELLQAIETG